MSDETGPGPGDPPSLHEGVLDTEGLLAFERDLRVCAEVAEVRVRVGRGGVPASKRPTLEEAMTALRDGAAAAVQIRYRHDATTWLDTVMRADSAYRIVRTKVIG